MPSVLVSTEAGVMTLTLNRPEKLNAFVGEMHGLLHEAMTQAEADASVRVVLLTGAGRAFCSGQDLAERDMNDPNLDLGGGLDVAVGEEAQYLYRGRSGAFGRIGVEQPLLRSRTDCHQHQYARDHKSGSDPDFGTRPRHAARLDRPRNAREGPATSYEPGRGCAL